MIFPPMEANASTSKSEVELAIEKTINYIYSTKGSVTIEAENRIFGGNPTQSRYIRDKNNSEYLYEYGAKFIKNEKGQYLHSSYLRNYTPFDRIIPLNENVMYLIPDKFSNFYQYGKGKISDVFNSNVYFRFLGIRNYFSEDSVFDKNENGIYSVVNTQEKIETLIKINKEGFVTELISTKLGEKEPYITEKYSYDEIENILSLLPAYDYKNIEIHAKTEQYNNIYLATLMKSNLSFVYRMAGIEAKRLDTKTGDLLIKNITSADIKKFLEKELKYWYSNSNSLSTDKGYKQVGDKIQQSLKGYNNKIYTGCLSKKGTNFKFVLNKC